MVEVPRVTFAGFLDEQGLRRVTYAWIDVEGNEEQVIRGMRLEARHGTFPIFQYELSATWSDQRKAKGGNWTQRDAAAYLESHGYSIYVIGVTQMGRQPQTLEAEAIMQSNPWTSQAKLLPVRPSDFASTCLLLGRLSPGNNMQGNALAVNWRMLAQHGAQNAWVARAVERASNRTAPGVSMLPWTRPETVGLRATAWS